MPVIKKKYNSRAGKIQLRLSPRRIEEKDI